MNNPYLLIGLGKTPEILRRLLAVIPPERFDDHPNPERFSLREALCHLADWEPIFLERIKGTISDPNYKITPQDEAAFVITHNYADQAISDALDRFTRGREELIEFLVKVSGSDWNKAATHPERGLMSVADQASLVLGHDLYHIDQFVSRIA